MAAGLGWEWAWRMSRIMTWCTGLALVGAVAGCGQAAAVRPAGSWGRAIEVPGLGALNKGNAAVFSVSCGLAGSCAAGGYYTDGDRHQQGFVAAERNGRWGTAIKVPGLAALNKGGASGPDAEIGSVSCASAGNCAVGGSYTDQLGQGQAFVATERYGRWGMATGVPGLGALNAGGHAYVYQVSCASAGNCAAGGDYRDGGHHQQGFVVSEKNGVWGHAIEVPGLGALNAGAARVSSVSCGSAGNCMAGGDYTDGDGSGHGFVVSEKNGVWGQVIGVPGLGARNKSGDAAVSSVSCGSAGNCMAGGDYTDGDGSGHGFVVSEKNGVWGQVIGVPGLGARNKSGDAAVSSVSCGSAGNCMAGGDYTDGGGSGQGFVVSEKNGVWGQAIKVPGLGALNAGFNAAVDSVSCASAGNCTASGDYGEPYGSGFVVSEKNGIWGRAIEVPGLGALHKSRQEFPGVVLVSCGSPGNCAVGGLYANGGGNYQGFIAVAKNGVWGRAIEMPGLAALNKDGGAYVSEVSCAPAGSCAAGGLYQDRRGHYQGFVVSQTG